MKYAYVRVSTREQNISRQIDSIKNYAADIKDENIFIDKTSGKAFYKKSYTQLKNIIKNGDELILHELDRLGRNKEDIKKEFEFFRKNNITVRILNLPTTLNKYPAGQEWLEDMVNNIIIEVYSSLAEQEAITISKRTKEGLQAAKKKGSTLGRPSVSENKVQTALNMRKNGYTFNEIKEITGISKTSFYRYLLKENSKKEPQ